MIRVSLIVVPDNRKGEEQEGRLFEMFSLPAITVVFPFIFTVSLQVSFLYLGRV